MKRYFSQEAPHELLSWTVQEKIIIFDITSETRVIIAVEIVIKIKIF
jgi:hypothetical protein